MHYVRFDLYIGGEKHERGGLLHCAWDTDIFLTDACEKANELMTYFCDVLPIPPYDELGYNNEAFFTPRGYARFQHYVEPLARLVNEKTEWHAEPRIVPIDAIAPERIQYQDDYQVIIAKEEAL